MAAQPSHCPATEKPRLPVSMSRTIVTVSGTDLQGKCSLSAFKSKARVFIIPLALMRELAWVVLLPGDAGVVVEDLESAEVPAPALVAVAHQALVTHRVQRRLACPHPQHRVGAALPGGPGHLETTNIVDKQSNT